MKLFALLFALFSVAAAAREPFSFDRNSKAIKSHGKGRLSEHNVEHVTRKNAELKKRIGDFNPPPATASTVVGAQLRCSGFMCPQWALDVTRWDMVVGDGENPEWQLIELLPVAPTWQRMPNIFTDYDASTRMYTVCVQSYPAPGVDTFFQVQISDDISGARMVSNNVIVAHPDTSSNQPGSMSLVRMFDSPDPNGGIVAIFKYVTSLTPPPALGHFFFIFLTPPPSSLLPPSPSPQRRIHLQPGPARHRRRLGLQAARQPQDRPQRRRHLCRPRTRL